VPAAGAAASHCGAAAATLARWFDIRILSLYKALYTGFNHTPGQPGQGARNAQNQG